MTFELDQAVQILQRTPKTLHSLLNGLSKPWLENNEGENTWSPYEIVGHLIHGEKTDWMPRAKIILSDLPNKTFEPFDRFAQKKTDSSKTITELLDEFSHLRSENLKTLLALDIDRKALAKKGTHPELGEASLKELLSSWVVHDLGHISQICRVMAKQYKNEVGVWQAYLGILQ